MFLRVLQWQRAGVQAPDSVSLFPKIWEDKKPGYENVCSDFVATLTPQQRAGVDFPNFAGYYEAGSAHPLTPTMHPPHASSAHSLTAPAPGMLHVGYSTFVLVSCLSQHKAPRPPTVMSIAILTMQMHALRLRSTLTLFVMSWMRMLNAECVQMRCW